MAKAATKKPAAKAPTKSEVFAAIAESTELSKKDVAAVFEALADQVKKNMGKSGAGVFAIPDSIGANSVVAATSEGFAASGAFLVSALFTLNLILLLFNLMPLPPLDGAGALPLVLPERAALRYQELLRNPMLAIAGILIAWNVFGPIFRGAFGIALGLLYPGSY